MWDMDKDDSQDTAPDWMDRPGVRERINQLVDQRVSEVLGSLSRRDLLQLAAGVGVGAAGGSAMSELVEPAAANTNQGDIGIPGDPVDVFGSYYEINGNELCLGNVFSGTFQLSSGSKIISTGQSFSNSTYWLALGVGNVSNDVKVTGRVFWDNSVAETKVEIVETGTNVGNPTINMDLFRVR